MLKLITFVLVVFTATTIIASDSSFNCDKKCTRLTKEESAIKDCLTNCRGQSDKIKNFMINLMKSKTITSWDDMAKAYVGQTSLSLEERQRLRELGREAGQESGLFFGACLSLSLDLLGAEGLKNLLTESDGDAIWKQNFKKIVQLVDAKDVREFLKRPGNEGFGDAYFSILFEKFWGISLTSLENPKHFFREDSIEPNLLTPEDFLGSIKVYKPDSHGRDDEVLKSGWYTLVGVVDNIRAFGDPEFYARLFSQDDSVLAKALVAVEKQKRDDLVKAELERKSIIQRGLKTDGRYEGVQIKIATIKLDFDKFLRAALLLHLKKYDLDVLFDNIESLKDIVKVAKEKEPNFWGNLLISVEKETPLKVQTYLNQMKKIAGRFRGRLKAFIDVGSSKSYDMKDLLDKPSSKTTD